MNPRLTHFEIQETLGQLPSEFLQNIRLDCNRNISARWINRSPITSSTRPFTPFGEIVKSVR